MNLIEAAKNRNYGTLRKLENYFREYDFCFRDLRDKNVRILEIGVQGGHFQCGENISRTQKLSWG